MISIREATMQDMPALYALYHACGKVDAGYFEQLLSDGNIVFVASYNGVEAGIGILNWKPRYSLYRKLGIPEIQDLNVVPAMRRKGIASAMIDWCEEKARTKGCDTIGIGVGLTKDFGPAQILYVRKGYVPDGYGVTYDREAISTHATYRIDDDLSLMMVKPLQSSGVRL